MELEDILAVLLTPNNTHEEITIDIYDDFFIIESTNIEIKED